jgi:SAM-dependent methyltransferase
MGTPGSEQATAFCLNDLRVFDEAHLREVIAPISGAVPPAVAGCAFAEDRPEARECFGDLLARIERALSPVDRAAFVRAQQQVTPPEKREAACQTVLEQLFWDLTYWKTPLDYERLTAGEQVHLGALEFARLDGAVVLDAGAGTGRVTLPVARRARRVYAMEPAPPLLRLLESKLAMAGLHNVDLLRGVFRRVPLPDDSVDAVVACSAFGREESRGGERGLDELLRVTRPGGRIVVMWPGDPDWFIGHGFHYTALPGNLVITFPTMEEAWSVASRFYGPAALTALSSSHVPELPYSVLGVKPPRDLCWLTVQK